MADKIKSSKGISHNGNRPELEAGERFTLITATNNPIGALVALTNRGRLFILPANFTIEEPKWEEISLPNFNE